MRCTRLNDESKSLPFEKVVHKVTTRDAQPSSPTVASLIVSVTGLLSASFLPASCYRD